MTTPTHPTGRNETRGGHDVVAYDRRFHALATDVGPGWDYYLDRLVAAETGGDVVAVDFAEYHPADADHYRGLFSTTST